MNWAYLHSVIVIMAVLIVFLAITIMGGAWFLTGMSRRARAQKLAEQLGKIGKTLSAMSMDEARRLASDRLAMSPDFELQKVESPFNAEIIGLGPELQNLLTKFEEIHYLPDNSFVARSVIAPHTQADEWLRIGRDGEQDWLLARKDHDEIAVWNEDEDEPDQKIAERYPSIHHWLIGLMPPQNT